MKRVDKPGNVHAVLLGRLGGAATKGVSTPAKAEAARRNGRLGGRPIGRKTSKASGLSPAAQRLLRRIDSRREQIRRERGILSESYLLIREDRER